MKKSFFILLSFVLALGCFAFAGGMARPVQAEAAPEITPLSWYKFDDETNIGKDSMDNNHLTLVSTSNLATAKIKTEAATEDKYLELVRAEDPNDSRVLGGKGLYAPMILPSKDFADLVNYSYSVEITFRRDNTPWIGDHYVLTAGRYSDAFTIAPWKGGITIQVNNYQNAPTDLDFDAKYEWLWGTATTFVACDTNDWTTLLVSTDYSTKTASIYVNGELATSVVLPAVYFSNPEYDYTFCIGMQANVYGQSSQQFATVDIKDCKLFDYALSAQNVEALYDGTAATASGVYISAVEEVELPPAFITDVNTLESIIETLPKKVDITLSDGRKTKADVAWYGYPGANKLRGYLQSLHANVNQFAYELEYNYTADFDYDETLVTVSDIKLDGAPYVPGTAIDKNLHILTFKLTPLNNAVIEAVTWFDLEQEGDNGEYEVTFSQGATIIISAYGARATVTYYDGTTKLGESNYTSGGSEPLSSYPKTGYTFEGWYKDSALTQKVETLDYDNPVDITLYAKYKQIDDGKGGGEDGGCKSAVGGGSAAAVLVAAAAAVFAGKRRKA